MNIEFKCPQCGKMVTTDEAYRGRVVECPHCTKGIVVPRARQLIAQKQNIPLRSPCQRPSSNMIPSPRIPIPTVQKTITTNDKPDVVLTNRKYKIAYGVLLGVNAVTLLLVTVSLFRGSPSTRSESSRNIRSEEGITLPISSHTLSEQEGDTSHPIQARPDDNSVDADTNTQDVSTNPDAPKLEAEPQKKNEATVIADTRGSIDVRSVIEKICLGERLGGKEWEKRLRREFGASQASIHLKEELAKAGYWALRIEAPGMTIHVGHLTDSAEGFIKEGLGGGFTYPKWLPEADAEYIYNAYLRLEKEEVAFQERIREIDIAFKASEFYITPEEEERIEQATRLEYAKPLFSSICLESSRYLYCQKRLQKSVISAQITDRRWEQLKEAQTKEEWLKMINIIYGASKNDDAEVMFDKFPDKDNIANIYRKLLDYKWKVKVVFRKAGISVPVAAQRSDFRHITDSLQNRMPEREIIANYGEDRWTEYNKLNWALRNIKEESVPYPIDLKVRVGHVGRDGCMNGFNFNPSDHRFAEDGTFEFSIGEGNLCMLFVDDDWYWEQAFSDPQRKRMEKYESVRQAYLSDIRSLLKEANQGRYDKGQTSTLRKDIIAKHSPILFFAITQFMGTTVTLPPCPVLPPDENSEENMKMNKRKTKNKAKYKPLNAESTDYEGDIASIDLELDNGKNRFKEYDRERLEREKHQQNTKQRNSNSGYRPLNKTRSGSKPYKWSKTL